MEINHLQNQSILTDEQYAEYQRQLDTITGSEEWKTDEKMVVCFDSTGTFHKLYDDFNQAAKDFPLHVDKMLPCFCNGFIFHWFRDLEPVDKLRVIALNDIKNKEN